MPWKPKCRGYCRLHATNKGRGKGKPGSDVLLETRVSDLEKASAVHTIHTSTEKSVKATTNFEEVTSIAGTLSKATKEIAKLHETSLRHPSVAAAPAAGHVQDVARQEAVNSNNTRSIEVALETLASFKTQLVDLQQKVSTIEVSMSPAAPETPRATAWTNQQRPAGIGPREWPEEGRWVGTMSTLEKGLLRGLLAKSQVAGSHLARGLPGARGLARGLSRSRFTARGRSTETSPRKTTPSKRYDVCMMCV
jgi:hypothetical protein